MTQTATNTQPSSATSLLQRMYAPVSIDFLVYFRIAFGAIMLWEMVRYIEAGWVQSLFIDPPIHFTYFGFSWVKPWPGDGMHWHFYVLLGCAACIMLGFCYRLAAVLFAIGFTHVFLIDQSYYLNHFYLVCLVSFTMVLLPANRAFSLDAKLRPKIYSAFTPVWTFWILRILVGITYSYGAIAKLGWDWLTGNPMRQMLAQADTYPILGQFFHLEPVIRFYAWSGLFLDLLIVPALMWKRTRLFALLAAAFFHLSNDQMFQIGIFPWFMLTSTLILWPPKKLEFLWFSQTMLGVIYVYACVAMMNTPWGDDVVIRTAALFLSVGCLPLMLWKPARVPGFILAAAWLLVGPRYFGYGQLPPTLVSILPGLIVWAVIVLYPPDFLQEFRLVPETDEAPSQPGVLSLAQQLTAYVVIAFVAIQLIVPFRHWLYPGTVHWTEEGHLFAWHMKLRYKNGAATFYAFDKQGKPISNLLAGGYLVAKSDEQGNLTHLLDGRGVEKYSLATHGKRVLAVDADGTARFGLDAAGFPRFELGEDGERIALLNNMGDRVCRIRTVDDRLLVLNHLDVPLYEIDEQGRFIFLVDKQGERERSFNPMQDRVDRFGPEDRPVRIFDDKKKPILRPESPYYLSRRQRSKMAERPEMLIQYAHYLVDALKQQGFDDIDLRTESFCSLNGREPQRFIDPEVNLAKAQRSLGHVDWILPLDPTAEPGVLYKRELARRDDQE